MWSYSEWKQIHFHCRLTSTLYSRTLHLFISSIFSNNILAFLPFYPAIVLNWLLFIITFCILLLFWINYRILRVVKDTIGAIAESEKDVKWTISTTHKLLWQNACLWLSSSKMILSTYKGGVCCTRDGAHYQVSAQAGCQVPQSTCFQKHVGWETWLANRLPT